MNIRPITAFSRTRITRSTIQQVWKRRSNTERLLIRDTECGGLALIVGVRTASWMLSYKPRGNNPETGKRWASRSLIIGTIATLGPEAARAEANRLKRESQDGRDPGEARKKRIAAASVARSRTARAVLERYTDAVPHRPKLRGGTGRVSPRYAAQEATYVKKGLVLLGAFERPMAEITTAAIARMLAGLVDAPAEAWHTCGALGRFFEWACENGFAEANPVAILPRSRRPRPGPSRSTYLAPQQIALLYKAAEDLAHPVWRDLARFLLAVPTRAGLALKLRWDALDLVAAVWTQVGQTTKNGDLHKLHLPALVLDILRERQTATGDRGLVFPSPLAGKPVATLRDIRNALAKATSVTGWTWHDIRRSFATGVAEAGIPEAVVDAILNHRQSATRSGVLAVYQRSQRWPEQVKAMEAWAKLLTAAIRGEPYDNVVDLQRA